MSPELVDRERRRQVAVGIDLGEQFAGLLLDGRDRIRACNQRSGGCSWSTTVTSAFASFAGSPPCLPLIASQAGRVWAVRPHRHRRRLQVGREQLAPG
jgi:hypothetical protein